jgi:hypothetical protein
VEQRCLAIHRALIEGSIHFDKNRPNALESASIAPPVSGDQLLRECAAAVTKNLQFDLARVRNDGLLAVRWRWRRLQNFSTCVIAAYTPSATLREPIVTPTRYREQDGHQGTLLQPTWLWL